MSLQFFVGNGLRKPSDKHLAALHGLLPLEFLGFSRTSTPALSFGPFLGLGDSQFALDSVALNQVIPLPKYLLGRAGIFEDDEAKTSGFSRVFFDFENALCDRTKGFKVADEGLLRGRERQASNEYF